VGRGMDGPAAYMMDMLAQVAREVAKAMPPKMDPNGAIAARIKAISNVFEVGKPEPDYDYVEWLNDGRGYTVTNYGFCTSTGEVSSLIRLYAAMVPDTPLKRFLALMPPASQGRGSLGDFPALWRREVEASDRLAAVCEEEADRLFFNPAMAAAEMADIQTPVGKLVFYDTWLQHGDGDDPDSFNAIYARARQSVSDRRPCPEADFLQAFLSVRKAVLLDADEPATRSVWRESAPRVDALLNLLDTNAELVPPVTVANAEIHMTIG
jgi:chitosanase